MGKRTVLYKAHQRAGGKLVAFGGWDMPLHYGSQVEEHYAVRRSAGVFDVSHMTVIDVSGQDSRDFLRTLFANNVDRLTTPGKALYTGMLNPEGGVIDDLIVYGMGGWYRVVVNCATREKDLEWMARQAARFEVSLEERPEIAMIAVQGPDAREKVASLVSVARAEAIHELKVFHAQEVEGWFIARTGYTGEDGLEIMMPEKDAEAFWQALLEAGVHPAGLGARDTLRLEAGMNLYGADMDESISPLSANMGWCVAWEPADRDFIGRQALEVIKVNDQYDRLVGLMLEGRGMLRSGQEVIVEGVGKGVITSGTFSPTLGHAIAMARVPAGTGSEAVVDVRGKFLPVRVGKVGFVRNGKKVFN